MVGYVISIINLGFWFYQSDFHYQLGGIARAWNLSFLTRGISVDLVVVFE
jgi:hypothetical protein